MNDRTRYRGRMAIYAMAGVYLLFMAYNLMKDLPYSSGNQKILMIVFMVFFAVVGAAMVILGLVKGYKVSQPYSGGTLQETEALEEETGAAETDETEEKITEEKL